MKVAAAVFKKEEHRLLTSYKRLAGKVSSLLELSYGQGVNIVVLPALLGCIFENDEKYLEDILGLSDKYKGMAICPGSFFEREKGCTYHSSCIMLDGNIIARQRQIYLAKWEQGIGLARGKELTCTHVSGMKVCIIISTDVFYPQVSRAAAMSGAELVLSPVAILGTGNRYRQLSGLWQNTQANLFFGIESGFKGSFGGLEFNSLSMVHAPLDMTEREDGFMDAEGNARDASIITAVLDNEKRKEAVKKFNTFAQLNFEAYRDIFDAKGNGGSNV